MGEIRKISATVLNRITGFCFVPAGGSPDAFAYAWQRLLSPSLSGQHGYKKSKHVEVQGTPWGLSVLWGPSDCAWTVAAQPIFTVSPMNRNGSPTSLFTQSEHKFPPKEEKCKSKHTGTGNEGLVSVDFWSEYLHCGSTGF